MCVYVPIVREAVAFYTIPLITIKTTKHSDGLLELLSTLVMDGMWPWLVTFSTAYPLLQRDSVLNGLQIMCCFLLHQFSWCDPSRPDSNSRLRLLWCNYGDIYLGPKDVEFQTELAESFLFTVLGRRVTLDEVKKLHRIGSHLPQNQVVHISV